MVEAFSGIRGSLGPRELLPALPEALVPTSLAAHLSLAHPGSEPVSGREGAVQSHPHVLVHGLLLAACEGTLGREQGIGAPG